MARLVAQPLVERGYARGWHCCAIGESASLAASRRARLQTSARRASGATCARPRRMGLCARGTVVRDSYCLCGVMMERRDVPRRSHVGLRRRGARVSSQLAGEGEWGGAGNLALGGRAPNDACGARYPTCTFLYL